MNLRERSAAFDNRFAEAIRAVGGVDHGLIGKFASTFAHRALDLLGRAGLWLEQPLPLSRREILAALGRVKLAVGLIPPVLDVDHVDEL